MKADKFFMTFLPRFIWYNLDQVVFIQSEQPPSYSWTENNWSMLGWLCTRTSLLIQVLLPSAFQELIPVAFSPLDMFMLVRDTSQPENKGWSLCQPQLSGKRLNQLLSQTQWCSWFSQDRRPLCFTHHVWPCVSFETALWNGCCCLMNTLDSPLL